MRAAALLVLLGTWPAAHAHSPVAGIGAFYGGMLHPLVAPQALIALLAVGLLIGQRGLRRGGAAVAALLAALALGLAMGAWEDATLPAWTLLLGSALSAIAVVAARDIARPVLATTCAALGLLVGAALAEPGASGTRFVIAAGTWLGAGLCALATAAVAELASRPWQHVAVRVVASWLAASAVLMLALDAFAPASAPENAATAATLPSR